MNHYAVDFETYYKVKSFGIGELGIYHYLRSAESDIYLVSIVGDDGLRFVGHPKDAPWDAINKPDAVWLSHNAGFDHPVFDRLQELGQAPKEINISAWWCTADLTAYLGLPRSLKEASHYLLGKTISKDVRDKMSGKRWETMTPEFQKEVMDYALNDSEDCLNIWLKHGHKWPHHERLTSFFTRQMAYYGVPVDLVAAQAAVTKLETAIWEAEALIPWAGREKTLSATAIRTECATQGIWCPDSFAKDAPDVERWENEFSERFPWIKAVRNYRRSNKHLATAKSMLNRTRPDGRMAYGLKYFGAHTGRDSGDSGWNAQNLPKGEICGVDLRKLIKAPEGKTFVICDLSAIEPRVLAWLCKDTKTLGLLASGMDIYESHARATMGYSDPRPLKEVDKGMRSLAKARCLAGTTPILTDKGYFSIAELQNKTGLRVWDGVEFAAYERVQQTGVDLVRNYGGEHFTESHEVFLGDGSTQSIGEVFTKQQVRGSSEALLGRTPPGGNWADVWKLANFVLKSLSKEYISLCKSFMHNMFNGAYCRFFEPKKREDHAMRKVRGEAVKGY